jgi:hypothetical protein
MTRALLVFAYLICIVGVGASMNADVRAQADAPAKHETKDRLSTEHMEALVAGPMALVRAGDLAGGERAFETLLADATRRHGAGSAEAADLLMSFGVTVFTEGMMGAGSQANEALRPRAVPYLRRSVEAYRGSFGADHPLVAVALHSLALAMLDIAPDDPPAEAEAALEEAYRIRLAVLGPANPETLAALGGLADIRALPSRTGHDPARIAAVAAMYREGLAHAPHITGDFPEKQPRLWFMRLARLYVRNGQAAAALRIIDEAQRQSGAWPCADMSLLETDVANLLQREGFAAEAEALSRRDPIDQMMECLDRERDPVVATS